MKEKLGRANKIKNGKTAGYDKIALEMIRCSTKGRILEGGGLWMISPLPKIIYVLHSIKEVQTQTYSRGETNTQNTTSN